MLVLKEASQNISDFFPLFVRTRVKRHVPMVPLERKKNQVTIYWIVNLAERISAILYVHDGVALKQIKTHNCACL